MTLQEAKDEVAKNHRQKDWDDLVTHYTEFDYECTVPFLDEAAELYASSLRSELAEKEKEIEELEQQVDDCAKYFMPPYKDQLAYYKSLAEAGDNVIEACKKEPEYNENYKSEWLEWRKNYWNPLMVVYNELKSIKG